MDLVAWPTSVFFQFIVTSLWNGVHHMTQHETFFWKDLKGLIRAIFPSSKLVLCMHRIHIQTLMPQETQSIIPLGGLPHFLVMLLVWLSRVSQAEHINKKPLLKKTAYFTCYTRHLFDSWWNHYRPSVPTVCSPPPFHCLLEACILHCRVGNVPHSPKCCQIWIVH